MPSCYAVREKMRRVAKFVSYSLAGCELEAALKTGVSVDVRTVRISLAWGRPGEGRGDVWPLPAADRLVLRAFRYCKSRVSNCTI